MTTPASSMFSLFLRIRQFSRPETIFDYFAKYAIEKERRK